ncbi:Hypothetical protein SCF082_LOCUS29352 [Durusdinium trenchii]|uniref:Carboxymuconolactone decarboxylase-like domain-containing protein n=1 Tax=Durusdinium trenchii TaxID=1381693 RepID=A0ABP0MVD3_9DINO
MSPKALSRLPELLPSKLSPAQKKLYDQIAAGAKDSSGRPLKTRVNEETGGLLGPFNAFLRSPQLGADVALLAEHLRFGELECSQRLLEICILRTVQRTGALYALWSHQKLAAAAGVASEIIKVISEGKNAREECKSLLSTEEAAALALCDELLQPGMVVSEATYSAALAVLGERRGFEVSVTAGFYLLLSAVLKTFDVRPPEDLPQSKL